MTIDPSLRSSFFIKSSKHLSFVPKTASGQHLPCRAVCAMSELPPDSCHQEALRRTEKGQEQTLALHKNAETRRMTKWGDLQEGSFRPLHEAALSAAHLRAGTPLLDVGCGARLALEMAHARGAKVSGLDAAANTLLTPRMRWLRPNA
jgi:hypothetical protein